MMADWTPSEQELLEYVEDELGPEEAERVRLATAASPELAETVAGLERARTVLRSAPTFELPGPGQRALLERLPKQKRDGGWSLRGLASSPRRLLVVLTPVAAAAAVAIALTTTLGHGREGERSAGNASLAQTAPTAPAAAPGASAPLQEGAGTAAESARAPVASVAGPPKRVANVLRDQGFEARVVGEAVEVRGGADPTAVTRALAGRAGGNVKVFVLP